MKVYLVQVEIDESGRFEPIAIKTNFEVAMGLFGKDDVALITEMELDEEYPEGIGICEHWHFPDEPEMEK